MQRVGRRLAIAHAAARIPQRQRRARIGQRQVLGKHLLPDIGRRRIGRELAAFVVCLGLGVHGLQVALDEARVAPQVGREAGDRQQVDAVDLARLVGPPGVVHVHAAEHHAGLDRLVLGWEDQLVDVEPVVVDGVGLVGEEVDSQVAQRAVAGDFAPQDQAGPGVDGLAGRLLVVAEVAVLARAADAHGPGVALVGVVVAQVREVGTAALGVGDVADQQLDHRAPFVPGGPGRVAQRNLGGGADPVAVVEVVVVHLLDREELVRIRRHRAQLFVQHEVAGLAVAAEPELHALLGQGQQLVTLAELALLLGHGRHLRQPGQAQARPVDADAPVVGVLAQRQQVAAAPEVA